MTVRDPGSNKISLHRSNEQNGSGIKVKYLGGKFVSPVFTISLIVFCVACGAGQVGGVGPCGPSNDWGVIWLLGYPIGFLGILLGAALSLVRICRHIGGVAEEDSERGQTGSE